MIAYCCSANKARGETIIDSGKNHLQARAKHTTFATKNREVELCSENSGVRLFGFRYANSINSASYFHTMPEKLNSGFHFKKRKRNGKTIKKRFELFSARHAVLVRPENATTQTAIRVRRHLRLPIHPLRDLWAKRLLRRLRQ